MKLCRYDAGDGPQPGIAEDGDVVHRDNPAERHDLEDVRLLAPVQPRKFTVIEEPEDYLAPEPDQEAAWAH